MGEIIYRFNGEYRFLSNFYPAPIEIGPYKWSTAEHAYQAAKSVWSQDWDMIRSCVTPGAAKKVGRSITLRTDWDWIKLDVMEEIVREKFSQHSNLAKLLRNTGSKTLIEGNTWGDYYWGQVNGFGQNHLGIILMKIRSEI